MKKLISITLVIILLITACLVTNVSANGDVVIVDGIKYTEYDTYCVLTKCGQLKTTDIVIPKEVDFNGKKLPVTSINGGAFEGSSVTSVIIPDSITSIGDRAFSCCADLTSITIPDSVTSIGFFAFQVCALKSVTIPGSVTSIDQGVFYSCRSLESVTIEYGVTSISYYMFEFCSALTNVTIPNSVTKIGYEAFRGCSSLTSVDIPDSVTEIVDHAFFECDSLTNVTIPDGIRSISEYMFAWSRGLTSVTIPDSVTEICKNAFREAPIKMVFFKGTEEQWNNIWIDSGNDAFMTAKIIFNYDGSFTVGDTNGDWEINNKDVVALFRYVSGGGMVYNAVYDINDDGAVNNKDVVKLFKKVSTVTT